jgi:hypothetical protein
MNESYIADESILDPKSDIKPGIYDASILDSEVKAVEPAMTIGQRVGKAAEYLPTAGAIAGGVASLVAAPGSAGASLLGGSALAGLGAAAGKAGEQMVKRMVGQEAPKTSAEAAKQIGVEGVITGTLNATIGKLLPLMAPAFKKVVPGVLKAFQGIDERVAQKVVNDPDILFRAKPLDVAKKEFGEFFDGIGFKYGPRSVKEATGKLALSDNAADDLIIDTVGRIEGLAAPAGSATQKEVVQQALAARYSIGDAVKRAYRSGNNTKSRMFIEARGQIDDWLETQIPGFSAIRKTYEESMAKEAFSSVFPKNQNGTVSVLRSIAATAAGGAVNPLAVAAASPLAGRAAVQGAAIATTKPSVAAIANMFSKYITPDIIKAEYKAGAIDKLTAAQMLRENHGFQ